MEPDPLTSTWLLAVGAVLVLVVLCALFLLWMTHRRRKVSVSLSIERFGDQPYLRSADRPGHITRRRFADEFQVGAEVPVTVPDGEGGYTQEPMRVSRLGRVRSAVDGKIGVGLQAYLQQFEGVDLPISLPVSGDRGVVKLTLNTLEVLGRTGDDRVVWSCPWKHLRFVNPVDSDEEQSLVLRARDFSELRIDPRRGAGDYAEGLIIKYGRLAHRTTWGRQPGTVGVPATPAADSIQEATSR